MKYLAGPMSGYPKFNFPAFEEAAAELRAKGFEIISPHEQDSKAVQDAAWQSTDGKLDSEGKIAGETWGEILAKDVKIVADRVDGIIFLQEWWKSKGARLEAYVGLLCGHDFRQYQSADVDGTLLSDAYLLTPSYVAGICAGQWMPEPIRRLAQVKGESVAA